MVRVPADMLWHSNAAVVEAGFRETSAKEGKGCFGKKKQLLAEKSSVGQIQQCSSTKHGHVENAKAS